MPANKIQKERYYKLDEYFRNNMQKWSLKLLLKTINGWLQENEKSGISKRTLQDDLNYLKDVEGAPIIKYKEGKNNYFKYEDCRFSIRDKGISVEDERNLRKAINFLKQLKGLSIAKTLATTIQRLENKIELHDELTVNNLQFEQNENYLGNEWFSDTYEYLTTEKVMKLFYQPFESKQILIIHVHPYLLKQYNQRWFLIGWCEEHENIGIFPLDRFVDTRVSNRQFVKVSSFNADIYFKNLLGVTIKPNSSIQKIILEFNPKRAKYFYTKPFCEIDEQKTLENGNIQFSFSMIINPELEAAILHYGEDVKVVKPISLKKKIINILKNSLENYLH